MKKHLGMLLILMTILCLSVGYSALNTDLSISGDAIVRAEADIRVTNIELKSTENGGTEEYNPSYTVDTTSSFVSLPSNSRVVYEITISNNTGKRVLVNQIVSTLSNENISYQIAGLEEDEVYSGEEIIFTLTLSNSSSINQSGRIDFKYDLEIFDGYIISITQGENVLEDRITKDTTTVSYSISVNDDTVLRCDYGSVPSIQNNELTIKNISNDTTCSFYSDLISAVNEANTSENYLLMLKDYITSNTISISNDKKIQLDLNGKLIESSIRTIYNNGLLTVTDTSVGGTISNTGTNTQTIYNSGGNFTLKNGQIKSTTNCDQWYCSSLYNINNSLVNIDPIVDTNFNDDGSYKTGVYINQTYGIAVWVHSNSVANIRGGEYEMHTNSDYMAWQIFVCSTCDTLNIYDAHTTGEMYSSPIRGQSDGTINVYGGTFENSTDTRYIIGTDTDNFDGTINLYGGVGIGGGSTTGIANSGLNSTINICDFTFQNLGYDIGTNYGTIHYRDGIKWSNGYTPKLANGVVITKDNDLTCPY